MLRRLSRRLSPQSAGARPCTDILEPLRLEAGIPCGNWNWRTVRPPARNSGHYRIRGRWRRCPSLPRYRRSDYEQGWRIHRLPSIRPGESLAPKASRRTYTLWVNANRCLEVKEQYYQGVDNEPNRHTHRFGGDPCSERSHLGDLYRHPALVDR